MKSKNPIVYWIPPVIWLAVIWFASAISGNPDLPAQPFPHFDKVIHFGIYFLLAGLLYWALFKSTTHKEKAMAFVAFLTATVYGAIDEVHQINIPFRTSDVWDWVWDTIGALVCVVLIYLWRKKTNGTHRSEDLPTA